MARKTAFRPRTVVYFPVHNPDYPRNRRIRRSLESNGWKCLTITRGGIRGSSVPQKIVALWELLIHVPRCDAIVLSEMSLQYAIVTWLLARVFRKLHIVDGFIGLYETNVEDEARFTPHSVRARMLSLLDRIAIYTADIYLTDTELRRRRVLPLLRRRSESFSLPVGAPPWATALAPSQPSDSLRVLYYGNYIPLHGMEFFVGAWAKCKQRDKIRATLVGDGERLKAVRQAIEDHSLTAQCLFLPPVPERALRGLISTSDVVLGVFGGSSKAASVIPNKVWQGLACDRRVLTRTSEALAEIRELVDLALLEVDVVDAGPLADSLDELTGSNEWYANINTALQLEAYVEGEFRRFLECLDARCQLKSERGAAPIA